MNNRRAKAAVVQPQQFQQFMERVLTGDVIEITSKEKASVVSLLEALPPEMFATLNKRCDEMEAWYDKRAGEPQREEPKTAATWSFRRPDPYGDWWNRLDRSEKATVFHYVVQRFKGDHNRTFRGISDKGRMPEGK